MAGIKAHFSHGLQGWSMEGLFTTDGWQATGGNPGGYFAWANDPDAGLAYFVASERFEGDKSAYYGGKLAYDIETLAFGRDGIPDVEIIGANGTTLAAHVGEPGSGWTHEAITLDPSGGWRIGDLSGAAATRSEIKAVLADVDQLLIRASFTRGSVSGGLDNVSLKTAAPPASEHVWHIMAAFHSSGAIPSAPFHSAEHAIASPLADLSHLLIA